MQHEQENCGGSALTLTLVACGRGHDEIQPGTYRVVLQLPGGELPFGLDLERAHGVWSGNLINGPERVKLSEVAVKGSHLEIRMPGFENRLIADAREGHLTGEMVISKPEGKDQHLPLGGQFKQTYRFFPQAASDGLNVSGRWAVTFTAEDGQEEAAVGEFTQTKDIVTGTFLTNGGDHRYLAGQVQGNELYLSTFDGAHVCEISGQGARDCAGRQLVPQLS